jgi:chromosome partitioning protein
VAASDLILIPAKPDFLSTLGILYLRKSVKRFVKEYNNFSQGIENEEPINPRIIGVVFTMIQMRNGEPIKSQQHYIEYIKRYEIPVFDNYVIENNTIFARASQDGIPVSLTTYSNESHQTIVYHLGYLANVKKQILTDEVMKSYEKKLNDLSTREEGVTLLTSLLKNKSSAERFAKFLSVSFLNQDKKADILNQIVEATIGVKLNFSAINGE